MKRFWYRFLAACSPGDYVILIEVGRVCVLRGQPGRTLLHELALLVRETDCDLVCVVGDQRGSARRLLGVPGACEQRFRNVWAANCR